MESRDTGVELQRGFDSRVFSHFSECEGALRSSSL